MKRRQTVGGGLAGALGMTECQGNPASTPKVSPTSRPTAKCRAARGRQGYGHAGFGAGTAWQSMAVHSSCPGTASGAQQADLGCSPRGDWKLFSPGRAGQCVHAEGALCPAPSWGQTWCSGYQLCAGFRLLV